MRRGRRKEEREVGEKWREIERKGRDGEWDRTQREEREKKGGEGEEGRRDDEGEMEGDREVGERGRVGGGDKEGEEMVMIIEGKTRRK